MPKREGALQLFYARHSASRVLEFEAGLDEVAFRASPMCVDAAVA